MKPNFQKAQNTATELLLAQSPSRLHVDVRSFTLTPHIFITSIQDFCEQTNCPMSALPVQHCGALTLKRNKANIILYDDTIRYPPRKHWSIAHEVGHVYLSHTDDERNSEIEANFFAAQIIAPEIVLWELCKQCGNLSASDLPAIFNISRQSAEKRIQTLQRRGRYNSNTCDIKLLELYQPLIASAFSSQKAS